MPRGVGGTLGGAGTSTTRRGCCAAGARCWTGRHGRRRRGGRATAAGDGEDELRLPGSAARAREREWELEGRGSLEGDERWKG